MTVRIDNLVLPLAQKATDMRIVDTAESHQVRSSAVPQMIGNSLRSGDVDSKTERGLGIRISTMVTRTTITSLTSCAPALSANYTEDAPEPDFTFEELVQAYFDCRKRKRNTASALAFEQDLERNLNSLHDELVTGTYRPGTSICFVITKPKPREVWAADFRDRIVHHLFYNRIAPRFENSFIADSCACIKERGTLYAVKRLDSKIRSATQNWSKPCFYLKCDLANFFVAIDKDVLFAQIAKKINEPWWLWLAGLILFHDPRENFIFKGNPESINLVPEHKRLISHASNLGLPIGNLSSQFFANVYLDELDQFIKHRIRAKHYVRYVDDFVILHESPQWLNNAYAQICEFVENTLNAKVNPKKTILQPVDRGVDFVGQVVKPWRRHTRKRTINSALSAISQANDVDLFAVGNSYLGLIGQATASHKDKCKVARAMLAKGFCVKADLSKVYRRKVNHG